MILLPPPVKCMYYVYHQAQFMRCWEIKVSMEGPLGLTEMQTDRGKEPAYTGRPGRLSHLGFTQQTGHAQEEQAHERQINVHGAHGPAVSAPEPTLILRSV